MGTDPDALFATATASLSNGPDEAATRLLAEAVARFPRHAGLAIRHADALQLSGRIDEAAGAYRRGLDLDPEIFDGWYGLGCAALAAGMTGEAVAALDQATRLCPERADAQFNLAKALFDLGRIDAALAGFRAASGASNPALRGEALASIARIIPGDPATDHAAILSARRQWAASIAPATPPRRSRGTPHPEGKIRLGYFSAFFGARNWMKPVWGVVNHHDRTRFELHFFSDGAPPEVEGGYRDFPLDYVHDIRGGPNGKVADYAAGLGIDIAIDLNGYSHQSRLGAFMARPAPVVIGWFNMFATTGIPGFDYLVGDASVIPPREERFYSERVLRVPGSYLAFDVPYPVPPVVPPPSAATGRITFGCLGSHYKITDQVVACWGEILAGAPETRLLLKNGTLGEASSDQAMLDRLSAVGIAADRVILEGGEPHAAFLRAYDRIDLALDTFPYNGGTTTMEALWQGVPVLSFDGDRWASRTSRSLLQAAGLGAWCAPDRDGHVAQAIALARAPDTIGMLSSLRGTLRERLRASPACDSAGLCRALEAHYVRLARRRGRG